MDCVHPARSTPTRRCRAWLGFVLAVIGAASTAQPIVCHVAYAGATRSFVIPPQPHAVDPPPLLQGASVLVEVVNRVPPQPGAGVVIRTYGMRDGEPMLLHQGSYLPTAPAVGPHGFTGLQVVREPARGHELTYWCERTVESARHHRPR
ncbi:hypothetical protein Tchar_01820 [Tepidimonas charontis]|uniref:Uncharacterized protein n=1 Tax=Tepidimonas charontis TaxID=2267262 RepID=A0A554XBL1_9BURK|nr:hypothetical protein Tchar_01820 [Tepidimonas charontis]